MYSEFDERADIERGELEGLKPFLVIVALLFLSFVMDFFSVKNFARTPYKVDTPRSRIEPV